MAGRPATVRGGGLTGLHYGLIVFVVVSVASLGGFIFQLTKVKEADARAANAERRLDKFGRPAAPVGDYYENEASARGATVFAVMGQDMARMANLIAGTEDAVGATLEQQSTALLTQIAGNKPDVVNPTDTLLTAIRKLDERLTSEMNTLATTSSELEDKEREVTSLTQQLKSARDLFEQQVEQLTDQHEQDRKGFTEQLGEKETQLAELQNTLEVREQQLQQCKREGDQEKRDQGLIIERQSRQIADLQQKIQGLKGSFDPEAILRKADGRIMRAIPGSDVVYVNLGANDNIKVGMGFEVFSQLGSADRTLRGKASLEVATLMEDTAECRVMRFDPGQPILEGDIVVNIAYEQSRKPKFVVRGDFDLDFDGMTDADGTHRIATIIQQWGGQVVPELDESVDYVVVGVPPTAGEVRPGASDIVRDQAERRSLERSQFQRMIGDARSMYIPVITQNQFLFLTGYAGDAIPRGS